MNVAPDASFFTLVAAIFLVLNATGQIPLFLAMLGRFDQKRQIKIITRELCIALVLLLMFTFFGDKILEVLGITRPIIAIAGGILLFLISLTMIFPRTVKDEDPSKALQHEPMIIPLAIPVITGPGAITTVMLYSHETGSPMLVALAVFCAWVPSLIILLLGSYIKKALGEKGLVAVERLGGMLVCLIGIQMLTSGLLLLIREYFHIAV
ncbi:MAG TPA: MarC family protein [Chlamydiales bacterium]|nr:MarC family protein [Chlamydiales bacterium]